MARRFVRAAFRSSVTPWPTLRKIRPRTHSRTATLPFWGFIPAGPRRRTSRRYRRAREARPGQHRADRVPSSSGCHNHLRRRGRTLFPRHHMCEGIGDRAVHARRRWQLSRRSPALRLQPSPMREPSGVRARWLRGSCGAVSRPQEAADHRAGVRGRTQVDTLLLAVVAHHAGAGERGDMNTLVGAPDRWPQ